MLLEYFVKASAGQRLTKSQQVYPLAESLLTMLDQLHLTPVYSVLQMRPNLVHVDAAEAAKKKVLLYHKN